MAIKEDCSKRPVWLLCEGNDCYHFFMRVILKLGMERIYCLDVKGINDKDLFEEIPNRSNYNNSKVIIYIRDAEYPKNESANDPSANRFDSIIQSIKSRFASISLVVGDKPLELTDNNGKQVGYIILTDSGGSAGTLENLCLDIAIDKDAVYDANSTLICVNNNRDYKVNKHMHKRKMNIAFALNKDEKMIGAKTGEAVTYGGLDLNHERFLLIKSFLTKINELK